ncbi:dipeptide ABC transporter ATP-binding protein [Chelativorans xinjiangense]|uniref:dipeptide ABC transporter ATP-binding protein n=1 Tax=Chelativorans xinjiangense TaxID=2681485 RepID=UPI001357DA84|nr:dipeptide ABC transporter ATP-binding protein [Chelativorans xinjiangense]
MNEAISTNRVQNAGQPILEIENLSISFFTRAGEIPAVMDFSCEVMPGEAMGIVGESGCGKSTVALGIMRDLSNVGKIVGGRIKFKGRDMAEMSEEELRHIRGNEIAMIYQEPMASLNPAMKIGRQLMEVPLIHEKVSKEEAWNRALEMVRAVRLPDPERIMRAYPHQLSGGQQQRIVIAMALLSKPSLLLLDEPTTALDVTVEAGIVELVKGLGKEFGTSMIFVSHNLGLILETCDRITVMYSGEAVETGRVKDVFDRMRHPYTQGLFRSIPLPGADKNAQPLIAIPGQLPLPHERPRGCNFGPRCQHFVEGVCDAAEIPMIAVKEHKSHHSRCVRFEEIDWKKLPEGAKTAREPVKPGAPMLKIDDLKKYYHVAANAIFGGAETRTVKANEAVSFEARESETVAIVGESGCGKSTLAKVLLGLETATEGTVTLGNTEIQGTPVEERDTDTVAGIQMVFQNPFDTLNPSHSVGAQIMRTLEKFKVGKTVAERRSRMLELLDLVKLPRAFASRMPRQLSGGQKQRIGVARAFAGNAKVVVADEPVSALDVSVQAAVTELLMDIQRKNKTTMLFISHDLSVVRYLADRVVVMYLGHIVEQGTTDQIFAPPYHPYTEALLSAIPIADTSVRKKHIVLEGDIPSAMDPPSGCPFQTRCRYKHLVPDNLCERELPPFADLGEGHRSLCWLGEEVLKTMEPVISFDEKRGEGAAKPARAKPKAGVRSARAKGGIKRKAKAAPVETASAVPGFSAPKKVQTEVGGGRQAASARVKPGLTGADKNRPPKMRTPRTPDDLKLISGVGPKLEAMLNGLGIYTYAQIAAWKKAERQWVDEHLKLKGRIEREDWVKQAKALARKK